MRKLTALLLMVFLFLPPFTALGQGTVDLMSFPVCQSGPGVELGGMRVRDYSGTSTLPGNCSFTIQLPSWTPMSSCSVVDENTVFSSVYSTVYGSGVSITLGDRLGSGQVALLVNITANLTDAPTGDINATITSQEPGTISPMSLAVARVYIPYSGGGGSSYSPSSSSSVNIAGVQTPIKEPTPVIDTTTAFEAGMASVMIDGKSVPIDVSPYLKNDLLYVPVRYLAYSLGLSPSDIVWDSATSTIHITAPKADIVLTIGSTTMLVNGSPVILPVAPEVVNERTMLPSAPIIENIKPGK